MRPGPRAVAWARLAWAPLLLLAVLWTVDLGAVLRQLADARPAWLPGSLAAALASNLVSAWRWHALVRWLGHPVRLGWVQCIYFQSMAVGSLLPGAVVGGDVFRALALRRTGMGALQAGLAVLLDRLNGLWMLGVLAVAVVSLGLFGAAAPAAVAASVLYGLMGVVQAGLGALLLARAAPAPTCAARLSPDDSARRA